MWLFNYYTNYIKMLIKAKAKVSNLANSNFIDLKS